MAFAVPFTNRRRCKMIDEQGHEEFEKRDPWDSSYLQLLDPSHEENDGEKQAEKEAPPTPLEAIEKFSTAMGEMDVILDLINNLEASKYLEHRFIAGKTRSAASLLEVATDRMARVGRRRAALTDASARLRRGASALRAIAANDNGFYDQVAQLQCFWRVRLNPATSEHVGSPYSLDLALGDVAPPPVTSAVTAAGGQAAAPGGGPASAPARYAVPTHIPLLKDPAGRVRIQLEPVAEPLTTLVPQQQAAKQQQQQQQAAAGAAGEQQQPQQRQQQPPGQGQAGLRMALGARQTHALLLELQQRLLWQLAGSTLDADAHASSSARGTNFPYSLAKKALAALGTTRDPALLALRPLLLEHAVTCRLPQVSLQPAPRQYVPPLRSLPLLPELHAWLGHINFRTHVWRSLEQQVCGERAVRLHWALTSRPCTSGVRLQVEPGGASMLLVMQDTVVEVEGVLGGRGFTSRWAKDSHITFNRADIPHLLHAVVLPVLREQQQ